MKLCKNCFHLIEKYPFSEWKKNEGGGVVQSWPETEYIILHFGCVIYCQAGKGCTCQKPEVD